MEDERKKIVIDKKKGKMRKKNKLINEWMNEIHKIDQSINESNEINNANDNAINLKNAPHAPK
jgi:hypothetical protein